MSHKKKKNIQRPGRTAPGESISEPTGGEQAVSKARPEGTADTTWLIVGTVVMLATLIWSYWPTLVEVVGKWESQPDYSHGYLVIPIALFFLWSRRGSLPWSQIQPSLWGLGLLLVGATLRVIAGRYFMLPLDGWTMPIMLAGAVWLLFGTRFIAWSWPAIVFTWFMFPIPYSAERSLSVPLQTVAAKLSTGALVMLGQPAIAEGNVIQLGDHTLFVEEACSGMRIFVGIFALAFAFVLFSQWSWWQKVIILIAALPVAVLANVLRIVATGLLYQWVSGEAAQRFSHDWAGYVMIPIAALFLWLFLVYLGRLFPVVEEIRQPTAIYRAANTPSGP